MTNDERDVLLTEVRTDVKWIKEQHKNHLAEHAKYTYFLITSILVAFIALFK